jgi:hypothetical protein
MGFRKTYTALGTALYFKYLYTKWRKGNQLRILDN